MLSVVVSLGFLVGTACTDPAEPSDSGAPPADSGSPPSDSDAVDSGPHGHTGQSDTHSGDTSQGDTAQDTDALADSVVAFAEATAAFHATLSKEETERITSDMSDPARKAWSNLPAAFAPRDGMPLLEMTKTQQELAEAMYQAGFSETGWSRVLEVRESEGYNASLGDPYSNADEYFVTTFGSPLEDSDWAVQLDGHHVVANFTVSGNRFDFVPVFWGVTPTAFELDGVEKQPLAAHANAALALIQSLEDRHDEVIVSPEDLSGLISGAGADEAFPEERAGVLASTLTTDQQAALMTLISAYLNDLHPAQAAVRTEEVVNGLDETYVAWYGPVEEGEQWDFRVHGPTIWIEFDHVSSTHIHAMLRDPTNDYGKNWLKDHRAEHPHP